MAKANRLQQNPPFGKGRDSPSDSQRSVTAPPLLLEKNRARCFGLDLNRSKSQRVFERVRGGRRRSRCLLGDLELEVFLWMLLRQTSL